MLLPLDSIAEMGVSECSMDIAMPQDGLNTPEIAAPLDHQGGT